MAARNKIVVAWKKTHTDEVVTSDAANTIFPVKTIFSLVSFLMQKKKIKNKKKAEKDVLCNILTYSKPDVFLA